MNQIAFLMNHCEQIFDFRENEDGRIVATICEANSVHEPRIDFELKDIDELYRFSFQLQKYLLTRA